MQMQLIRVAYTEEGTFGVLLQDNEPFAVTAEEVWRHNKRNISCIPPGRYFCERQNYGEKYESFLVQETEPRTGIFFHKGNTIADTEGCILVGERFEQLNDRYAIWHSNDGFSEFMQRLRGVDKFMLEIRDA